MLDSAKRRSSTLLGAPVGLEDGITKLSATVGRFVNSMGEGVGVAINVVDTSTSTIVSPKSNAFAAWKAFQSPS